MKGAIVQTKHPVAHSYFWYLIGSTIGFFIGAVAMFLVGVDPEIQMAFSTTCCVAATLIAVTWGEK